MRIFVAHLLLVQGLSSLSATFMINYRLSLHKTHSCIVYNCSLLDEKNLCVTRHGKRP